MKHFMIGISGFSGSGKDTVAAELIDKFQAIRIGLADPAKRHMADLYGFTRNQLFGPSSERNAGDLRYPKYHKLDLIKCNVDTIGTTFIDSADSHHVPHSLDKSKTYYSFSSVDWDRIKSTSNLLHKVLYETVNGGKRIYYIEIGDPRFWLSPRETLQKYCELMNDMYLDTWIRKSIETQLEVANNYPNYTYDEMEGIVHKNDSMKRPDFLITCSPDFRHWHEIKLLRSSARENTTVILIRVKRPSIPKPPYQHRSEIEQTSIPDSEFNFVLDNCESIECLNVKTEKVMRTILDSGLPQTTVFL